MADFAGLAHIALAAKDGASATLHRRLLNELGVGRGGIVDTGYGSGLGSHEPGEIALELFAPPSK